MVSTVQTGVMEPVPAPRPRGRPRKVQPEIDPSLPLHPWANPASTSRAIRTTSYAPPQNQRQQPVAYVRTTPQPQPHSMPAPVPAQVLYAPQPAPQPNYAYPRAVATPGPETHIVASTPAPMAAPKRKGPTKADLDFLLGGASRARSATPQVSRASAAPTRAPQQPTSLSHQYGSEQAVAGSSRAPMQSARASIAPNPSAVARRSPPPAATHDQEIVDDGLALGAEAVMESDHNPSSPLSSYHDNDEDLAAAHDDPNDRDFRPPPYVRRSIPGDPSLSTPPTAPRRRGRPSLAASSSGAKVAGSLSSTPNQPKRGRPRNDEYTPDVLEKMRIANEILAAAETDLESGKRIRLDDIIDRKTRQALSPEMQKMILKARNTQLQRVRREKLKQEAAAAAARENGSRGGEVKKRGRGRPSLASKQAKAKVAGEEGEGEGIVERAKGKVSEWIKMLSSEPEPTAEREGEKRDLAIDPELEAETRQEREDKLVDESFSRFGTVTGTLKGQDDISGRDPARTYQAGALGDEYYFSN